MRIQFEDKKALYIKFDSDSCLEENVLHRTLSSKSICQKGKCLGGQEELTQKAFVQRAIGTGGTGGSYPGFDFLGGN